MIPSKSLPARPSLESLRKQAKRLARNLTVSYRDAQLALAREYGFPGWGELRQEVLARAGKDIEWALPVARRAIHENDVVKLKELLAEHSKLLTWLDEQGQPLLQATTPYAMDVSDPQREKEFCRPDCAAALIDAGAVITPSVWDILIRSGAAGMLALLQQKHVLPHSLVVFAALGNQPGVRACLDESPGRDRDAVNYAFMAACRFKNETVAAMLLDRAIVLNPTLEVEIGRWGSRPAFLADMIERCPSLHGTTDPWVAFVKRQLLDAQDRNDLHAFLSWLTGQEWVLDDQHLAFQAELIGLLAEANREDFIRAVLEQSPALLRTSPPPPSMALIWALDAGHANLVPLLTRIWPLPNDLPHAAGVGDVDRVKHWFDAAGNPLLGDPSQHHGAKAEYSADPPAQKVLDTAFAWACLNHHWKIAEFLLGHGANINTTWNTHEAASVLHLAALTGDYELAKFLIDHGIDMSIRDYRWSGTAEGWACNVGKDRAMAEWLAAVEQARGNDGHVDTLSPL